MTRQQMFRSYWGLEEGLAISRERGDGWWRKHYSEWDNFGPDTWDLGEQWLCRAAQAAVKCITDVLLRIYMR
jgi:hypothetical protein